MPPEVCCAQTMLFDFTKGSEPKDLLAVNASGAASLAWFLQLPRGPNVAGDRS